MGVRRERPPLEQAGATITLRLPGGAVRTMPIDEHAHTAPDRCCFCGETVAPSEHEAVLLSAAWRDDEGREHSQAWSAHRTCLAERLHASAAGDLAGG